MKQLKMNRLILLISIVLISTSLKSQNQKYIGINLTGDKFGNFIHSGFGAFYENRLNKNSGFEFGLNYRSIIEKDLIIIPKAQPINSLWIKTRVNFISMPILYKYYSTIATISTGITFDYNVSWKDVSNLDNYETTSYSIDPKFYVGYLIKVGKPFKITQHLFLEPELAFNPIFKFQKQYLSASLKIKYKL